MGRRIQQENILQAKMKWSVRELVKEYLIIIPVHHKNIHSGFLPSRASTHMSPDKREYPYNIFISP